MPARVTTRPPSLYWAGIEICSRCAVLERAWRPASLAGPLADAEAAYRKAIEAEPGYALAHLNLAIFYELYGQRPELALETYRHYRTCSPDRHRRGSGGRSRISMPGHAACQSRKDGKAVKRKPAMNDRSKDGMLGPAAPWRTADGGGPPDASAIRGNQELPRFCTSCRGRTHGELTGRPAAWSRSARARGP